jgi:hypothetical protein
MKWAVTALSSFIKTIVLGELGLETGPDQPSNSQGGSANALMPTIVPGS